MTFDRNRTCMVYNENTSSVFIDTANGGMMLDGARNGVPASAPVYFEDIVLNNRKGNLFTSGRVVFDEADIADGIYDALHISDTSGILSQAKIEKMILEPTADTLSEIVSIKNENQFERIRGVYIGLRNSGADISQKISKVIDARHEEFMNGVLTSKIGVVKKEDNFASNEAVEALQKQIAEMAAKIDATSKSADETPIENDSRNEETSSPVEIEVPKPAVKKAGRPPKSTSSAKKK